MWNSFFTFIAKLFTTMTNTLDSVEKGLDIVNDYVDNAHKSTTRGTAKQAMLNTAQQHLRIQTELEADPKLNTIFKDLEAEW